MFKPGTDIDLDKISFSVKEIFDRTDELVRPYAEKKNLFFACHTDNEISRLVAEGDPLKLQYILISLLSNAIKFTMEGNVEMIVTHRRLSKQKIELQVVVKDTGIGISKKDSKQIFGAGEQTDEKKIATGGFGLALCKKITEMLGGEISVTSEPGMGSEFTVKIPFQSIGGDLSAQEKLPGLKTMSPGKPGIEVIEDDMVTAGGMMNKLDAGIYGFSLDQLNKIGNGNESFIRTMLDKFVSTASKNTGSMITGLANGDLAVVMNAAHKSIPSYHLLGLSDLVKSLQYIELNAREGAELSELSKQVERVHEETWKVISEIKKYLETAGDKETEKIIS